VSSPLPVGELTYGGDTTSSAPASAGDTSSAAEIVSMYGGEGTSSGEIRRVLARELHDRVARTLTGMLIELENFKIKQSGRQSVLREVAQLQESTRDVLNNLRHVLYDLRGQPGTDNGFEDRVRALLARFQENTQIEAILSVDPSWPSKLRSPAALNLYRIIEEALANVRLHSGAHSVEIALGPAFDGQVAVEVSDNGCGPEAVAGHRQPGLGIIGMRERALILGGRLEVDSTVGGGTTVRVILRATDLSIATEQLMARAVLADPLAAVVA
jgi:two-component system sensor histidine kinase UhpB